MAAGVLDAEEVATATALIWDHVEARSAAAYPDRPVSRGDPASWGGKGLWGSGGEGDGYGLLVDQHCAGMWYVRGLPRVHEMWTALHGGESSLAVSFDGAQLWRPWDVNPEWHAQDVTGFLHIDRRPFPAPTPAEAATAAAGWSPWRRAMGSSAFCRYDEDGACHGRIGTGYVQGFVSLIETTEAMVNATACARLFSRCLRCSRLGGACRAATAWSAAATRATTSWWSAASRWRARTAPRCRRTRAGGRITPSCCSKIRRWQTAS